MPVTCSRSSQVAQLFFFRCSCNNPYLTLTKLICMRKSLLLISLLTISCLLHAQITITGKVVDAVNGTPLAGVSVKIRSTKAGTSTNNEGVFKLQARSDDILEISIVGYGTQNFPLNGQVEP